MCESELVPVRVGDGAYQDDLAAEALRYFCEGLMARANLSEGHFSSERTSRVRRSLFHN